MVGKEQISFEYSLGGPYLFINFNKIVILNPSHHLRHTSSFTLIAKSQEQNPNIKVALKIWFQNVTYGPAVLPLDIRGSF